MPATVWTDVSIFNDEYLSEAKLDAMQGNADYVRDDHKVLLVGGAPGIAGGIEANIGTHSAAVSAVRLKLVHSAMTLYSTQLVFFTNDATRWSRLSIVNQAWSSPAAGSSADLVLSIEFQDVWPTGSWAAVGELCRIPGAMRRKDFQFVSAWVDVTPFANRRRFSTSAPALDWAWIRPRDLTILGSRENEGFAP